VTAQAVHRLLPLLALALNVVLLAAALASDRSHRSTRTFSAVASALALWNIAVFGLRSSVDPALALQWERLLHVAVALLPALFYHYVLAFLNLSARRASLIVAYALAALFIVATPSASFMSGVHATEWGYAPVAGPVYTPFLGYVYGYFLLGLARLVRALYRARPGFQRTRARWIVAGVIVSLVGGLVDFARFTLGWQHLYPIGIPANALFALALGVAVVRYRLMDIGVVVRRAVLYGLTSLALAPLVFAAVYLTAAFGAGGSPPLGSLGTSLIAVAAIAVAMPLLRKLERLLERLIFHREHGVRDALVRLGKNMPAVMDLRRLGASLTGGLVSDVPVRHASLYVRDPEGETYPLFERRVAPDDDVDGLTEDALDDNVVQWLRARRAPVVVEEATRRGRTPGAPHAAAARVLEAVHAAVVLPILEEGRLEAVLIVGEKRSGDGFDRDEIDLLEALAGNTSIALKNARLYDALRRRMEELQATQDQLLQSAKLAAIGELASSVAHEVNNPLMVIMGQAGLAGRELAGVPGARARLDAIVEQAHRAAKIIRDLLDFARRREPTVEALDIREVLERSLQLVGGRLSGGRVVANADVIGPVPSITGDRDQLTQVFVNLLTNAVDAMPHGGSVFLRTEVRTAAGIPCLSVTVSDTGIGMTREQLARVFEPFYTTKPEGQGTGLGLAVSAGIVRKHEGTLEAFSEPGKGSTFVVSLPIADA
jgi:signal transduction histidine kinase